MGEVFLLTRLNMAERKEEEEKERK